METREFEDLGRGKNVTELCKTSLRIDPDYATFYVFWSKVIFMELLPYALIISLNASIIYQLYKTGQFRERHSTVQQPSEEMRILDGQRPEANRNNRRIQLERDMAITLVAISLMFVICQSIKLIVDIYELTVCDFSKIAIEGHDPECHNPTKIDVVASLGNLFVCINSAANFLVYMIKGKRFREAFCHSYFSCGEGNIQANLQVQQDKTLGSTIVQYKNDHNEKSEVRSTYL